MQFQEVSKLKTLSGNDIILCVMFERCFLTLRESRAAVSRHLPTVSRHQHSDSLTGRARELFGLTGTSAAVC